MKNVFLVDQMARMVSADLENSHVMELSVIPVTLILFSTALGNCLVPGYPFFTPEHHPCGRELQEHSPVYCSASFVRSQGAGDPEEKFAKTILPKGVIKVVSSLEDIAKGTCQNPVLTSSLENSFAPESWVIIHMWHLVCLVENILVYLLKVDNCLDPT